MTLLSDVERMVSELSFPFSCSLECTRLSVGAIWRAVGIEITEDYDDPLEKLLDYMELTREFDREKLFIFVNLRSYFPNDKVEIFLKSVIGHEFKVILIDGREYDKLEQEKRVTIDKDLCEF
jgi:CRISPR type II-A-associated protein Csn2